MTGVRWLGCGMGKALLVSLRPCCMKHGRSEQRDAVNMQYYTWLQIKVAAGVHQAV